jgi:disulfide bond formation protein DsbB
MRPLSTSRLFRQPRPKHRFLYLLILIGCAFAIFAAFYMQNTYHLAPCPLCILQRFGFIGLGLAALFGLLRGYVGAFGKLFGLFFGLIGLGSAAFHNWVIAQPNTAECGRDKIQTFVNQLPTASLWPDMFMATGLCGAQLPLVFGLSIPLWSLILLFVFLLGFVYRSFKR